LSTCSYLWASRGELQPLIIFAKPLNFIYNHLNSKEDSMDIKEYIGASRRDFICTLSGMLSAVLLASPKRLLAKKPQIKNIVNNLELELLERARPQKDPSVTAREYRDATRLFRESDGQAQLICTVNHTGKTIWEACDGRNSLRDISRLVQQTYEISSHQAYVDCLTFLVQTFIFDAKRSERHQPGD
jgi:hypothetical protein